MKKREKRVVTKKLLSFGLVLFFTCCQSVFCDPNVSSSKPCDSYTTDSECPSGCIWDCADQKCRAPICADYFTNIACPQACNWSCEQNACVTSKQKPE